MEDLIDIAERAPKWADGIIVTKNGTVYPIKASRWGKDQYYFSPTWREVEAPGGLSPAVAIKGDKVYNFEILRQDGKYITIKIIEP